MKKRVLFVIDGIEFGGGERGFAQIINGLPSDKYEAFLACAANQTLYQAITNPSVRWRHIDFSNRYNVSIVLQLTKIIRNNDIHIVHGQGGRADFYARLAAGFSGRAKCISTVQMPIEGYDISGLTKLFYRLFDCLSEKFVNRFIVVSDSLRQSMIHDHHIDPQKVIKIYNGIETDIYKRESQSLNRLRIRQEFQVSEETILVGTIGRLVWQKGFEYFIQAIPALIRALPNSHFLIVGDGILRCELETIAESLRVRNYLHFTGHRKDIPDILAALDIFVLPSVLEGFPMVTLEAMAMQKKIVATRIDGTVEQITDEKEGILVAPRSSAELSRAIVRLASDRKAALALGNAARQKVITQFSVQQMIGKTIDVYEELF